MILRRRTFVGGTLAGLAAPMVARGQAWPDKAVVFINPFPAGGGTDVFARPLAAHLTRQLGQQIVIDNRGGAGGTVGASAAAKARPDGYTFFVGAVHHTIAPSIYKKLDYDLLSDFVPITMIALVPQVVSVHPQRLPMTTLAELLDHMRKNPGKVNYASAGAGTAHHLAGELFKILTKVDIVHVPFRGAGPAMQDLLAGQVDMMFDGMGTSGTQFRGGKLRGLAVASDRRTTAFPDIPTAAEAGVPGWEVSTWYGLWALKGTPQPIVDRMYKETAKALAEPDLKKLWAEQAAEDGGETPAVFDARVRAEVAKWAKVVEDAGVKLE